MWWPVGGAELEGHGLAEEKSPGPFRRQVLAKDADGVIVNYEVKGSTSLILRSTTVLYGQGDNHSGAEREEESVPVSSYSVFPALSVGFIILGKIFAYVTVFFF